MRFVLGILLGICLGLFAALALELVAVYQQPQEVPTFHLNGDEF